MKLNTYASEVIPGHFVTIPTAQAVATISLVDGLGALRLHLFKRAYRFPARSRNAAFMISILTQIVDQGYALHGPDALCEPARKRPRRPVKSRGVGAPADYSRAIDKEIPWQRAR